MSEKRRQEIMRLVVVGLSVPEMDESLTLDEERARLRQLHGERADFLRICTGAEELDYFAVNWERGGR